MANSDTRLTLERVQKIIAKATGAPLQGEAVRELEQALRNGESEPEREPQTGRFRRQEVTVLLADLRGFSGLTEAYPAPVLLGALNDFLTRLTRLVHSHGGTVDKFMGDSIMVLFGAPERKDDDARRAVACAVQMQIMADALNREHNRGALPKLYLGIGINTGVVMAGLLGSELYSEYTVIGSEVNLAARIEAFSLRGQILIGQRTYEQCRDFAATGEPMDVYVKGNPRPVPIREVLGIPSRDEHVPRQEVRRSHRVKVRMPFSYYIVRNNTVQSDRLFGTVLNMSYHGLLAELAHPVDRFSEIKLELDLSVVGHMASDVYARVVTRPTTSGAVGIEFTAMHPDSDAAIKRFVQLLIQGGEIQ